jgi:hypothetical protein
MKVDYFGLMKDSFNFTLKYKALWLFGFFLALFAGGSSGGNNSYSGNSYNSGSSSSTNTLPTEAQDALNKAGDYFTNLVNQPWFWVLVVVLIVLGLAFFCLAIYLTNISNTALVKAVKYDEEGKTDKITVKSLWNDGNILFWKTFLYGLLWGFVIFFVTLVMILPIIFMIIIPIFLCLLVIWVPMMIVVLYALSMAYQIGFTKLVFDGTDSVESFTYGLKLLRSQLKHWVISTFAMILPGLAYGFVMLIVALLLLVVFIGLPILAIVLSNMAVWSFILLGLCVFIFVLLMAAASAPLQVFTNTYWTKLYLLLSKEQ